MPRPLFLPALFSLLAPALSLPGSPIISEFMADNQTAFKDGDGNYSDWIEITNPDPTSVNLAGWFLTDDAANPQKFTFPPSGVTLAPGARLLVFASDKKNSTGSAAYRDVGGYLHSNFALKASGEYLGLRQPDGTTVSEFSPAYPAQVADVSYGTPNSTGGLLGTSVRWTVPTAATPASWQAAAFNDSTWTNSTGPALGYDRDAATAAWTFNDSASPAADNAGSSLPLTSSGTVTFNQAGANANTGTSVTLAGAGSKLTRPYSAALNPPVEFTFAAWVYPTGGSSHRSVVTSRVGPAGSQAGYILYINPSNVWEFWTGQSGAGVTSQWNTLSGPAVTFNAWTHIAIARDASGLKRLYINGSQYAAETSSTTYTPNRTSQFNLGAGDDSGTNFYFIGRIDDAAFFDRFIGTDSIASLMANGVSGINTSPYPAAVNTNVQAALYNKGTSLYARHSFTVADKSALSSLQLKLKYEDGVVAWLNGVEIARRNFPVGNTPAWNSAASGSRDESQALVNETVTVPADAFNALVNGTNTLALQALNTTATPATFVLSPTLENSGASGIPAGYLPAFTPGAANPGSTFAPGPAISAVTDSPAPPAAGSGLTINATVAARLGPVATVSLTYRAMYGSELSVAMKDDGIAPDTAAGDGIYAATIPALGGATARQMLRWKVTAMDTSARSTVEPRVIDLTNSDGLSQSPEYFGTVVADPALVTGPVLCQWFSADTANADTRVGSRASAWLYGRFYDNIYVRQRGGATSIGSQKFNFNRGHGAVVPGLGKVGELNMNSNGYDSNGFRISLAYDIYGQAGHPGCFAVPAILYRNGSYHRVGTLIEQEDEDYLDRHGFDPEGALYKFVQRAGETPLAGGDYSNSPTFGDTLYGIEKKTRTHEDFSDLNTIVAGCNLGNTSARQAFLFNSLNLPNFINFMALRALVGDADVARKNYYFYRDTNRSGEWFMLPWDKDWTLGVSHTRAGQNIPWFGSNGNDGGYFQEPTTTKQWNKLFHAAYQNPQIRSMVARRLRRLTDDILGPVGTPANASPLETRALPILAAMSPFAPGVTVPTGYASRTAVPAGSSLSFDSYLTTRRTELYTTFGPASSYKFVAEAPASAPVVTIDSADANPASGTQSQEYLKLLNSNAEDVDLSGWTLWSAGKTTPFHTFKPGSVLPGTASAGATGLNRATVCNNRAAYRGRPGSTTGTTAELVWGDYEGQLSARGETITLRAGPLTTDRLVSAFTVPSNPTAAQQFLRVSQLLFAPAAPTPAEIVAFTPPPGTALSASDFEFVELINTGTSTLNLAGARFTTGLDFTFPAGTTLAAGARLVVAENPAAFALRFGVPGVTVLGPYTGNLDNSGERIRLEDAAGEMVLDFTYDPAWFPTASSLGYALVVRNPSQPHTAWDLPATWSLSASPGGSPGASPAFASQEFTGWKYLWFNESERANPAVSGPSAVLSGSGVSNLIAYAFNLDPRSPDLTRLPLPGLVTSGPDQFATLSFPRWKNSPDLSYVLEFATEISPANWAATSVSQIGLTDNGDDTETVTLRTQTPISGDGTRHFLRLRVSVP